jgi:hypothetical protein
MLAASPVEELGVVDEGALPAVVLVCPLGLLAALAELGVLEALLDVLWEELALGEELALASGVVLGAVAEPEVDAALGGMAEALLSLEVEVEDVALGALALVGLLLLLAEPPAVALIVKCSSTFLIPAIDFAISLARFLSALEATVPVSIAV